MRSVVIFAVEFPDFEKKTWHALLKGETKGLPNAYVFSFHFRELGIFQKESRNWFRPQLSRYKISQRGAAGNLLVLPFTSPYKCPDETK